MRRSASLRAAVSSFPNPTPIARPLQPGLEIAAATTTASLASSREKQIGRCGENAGIGQVALLVFPSPRAGVRIERAYRAEVLFFLPQVRPLRCAHTRADASPGAIRAEPSRGKA